jgi:hypothetical protein
MAHAGPMVGSGINRSEGTMNAEKTMDVMGKLMAELTGAVKCALRAGMSKEDVLTVVQLIAGGLDNADED